MSSPRSPHSEGKLSPSHSEPGDAPTPASSHSEKSHPREIEYEAPSSLFPDSSPLHHPFAEQELNESQRTITQINSEQGTISPTQSRYRSPGALDLMQIDQIDESLASNHLPTGPKEASLPEIHNEMAPEDQKRTLQRELKDFKQSLEEAERSLISRQIENLKNQVLEIITKAYRRFSVDESFFPFGREITLTSKIEEILLLPQEWPFTSKERLSLVTCKAKIAELEDILGGDETDYESDEEENILSCLHDPEIYPMLIFFPFLFPCTSRSFGF